MKKKLLTILVVALAILGVSQIYNAAKPYSTTSSSDDGGGRGSTDGPF